MDYLEFAFKNEKRNEYFPTKIIEADEVPQERRVSTTQLQRKEMAFRLTRLHNPTNLEKKERLKLNSFKVCNTFNEKCEIVDLIADRQHHRPLGTDLNTTIQVISVRNLHNFV